MNQDARRSGHLRPGCRGDWIDLTTLTDDRQVYRCPLCGAIRKGEWPEVDLERDPMEVDDPVEERRASLPSAWWWVLVAVCGAVGLAAVLFHR